MLCQCQLLLGMCCQCQMFLWHLVSKSVFLWYLLSLLVVAWYLLSLPAVAWYLLSMPAWHVYCTVLLGILYLDKTHASMMKFHSNKSEQMNEHQFMKCTQWISCQIWTLELWRLLGQPCSVAQRTSGPRTWKQPEHRVMYDWMLSFHVTFLFSLLLPPWFYSFFLVKWPNTSLGF